MFRPWMLKRGLPFAGGAIAYPGLTAVPDLPAAKTGHRAVWQNSRIWVVGGNAGLTYSLGIGDSSWRVETAKPGGDQGSRNATSGMVVTPTSNTIMVCGGTAATNITRTHIFNTATRTWSQSGLYPGYAIGFNNLSVALASGGRVACAFGNAADPQVISALDQTTGEISTNIGKDFATTGGPAYPTIGNGSDVWHLVGNGPGFKFVSGVLSAIGAGTAHSMSGTPCIWITGTRWLLPGGLNGANPTNAVAEFNTATGVYTAKASMGTARYSPGAARLPDGRILVIGGIPAIGSDTATCELYDPNTNTWANVGSLRTKRSLPGIVTLSDGTILCVGGDSTDGGGAQVDAFDTQTLTWKRGITNPDA